jgi:predicted nucleic acid-binding protein
VITFLLDTSALWYLARTPGAVRDWNSYIAAGAFHICEPTRAEFLYSATGPANRDELADMLDRLCGSCAVPKGAWRWVDTAQYKLTQHGQHRAAGAVDLLVCAIAVHHGHTILHVDNDFSTVASVLKEVQERDVRV